MTVRQENKLSMYLAVGSVIDAFNAVWAGTPACVTAVGKLDDDAWTAL